MSDDLNATGHWRQLPAEIAEMRQLDEAERSVAEALLSPTMEMRLQVYGIAVDAIETAHRHVADHTDFDLAVGSRQAAVWTVAGRCIGLMRAALTLLAAGFGAESAVQLRALHETTRLLSALADDAEDDLLQRWLDDDDKRWVRPWEARNAVDRIRTRLRDFLITERETAQAAGDNSAAAELTAALELGVFAEESPLLDPTRQIYDVLSRIGHSRRSGIRDAVAAPLRQMASGPHPDPGVRAEYVFYAGLLVVEVLNHVGDALGRFYGPGWYVQQVKPLVDQINSLPDFLAGGPTIPS